MADAVISAVVGTVLSNVMSPSPPKPKETPTAPTPDDDQAKRLRERDAQRRYAGAGRSGTILSDSGLG
jgi:hypothetical protein